MKKIIMDKSMKAKIILYLATRRLVFESQAPLRRIMLYCKMNGFVTGGNLVDNKEIQLRMYWVVRRYFAEYAVLIIEKKTA